MIRVCDNTQASSLMRRLVRSQSGNTLAMMAAFLIPLTALVGSAVDTGRLYLVKVRLQQACDAGALAGRKFMVDNDVATLDSNAVSQAKIFFAQNFPSGVVGTEPYSATTNPYPFVPVKTADKQVAATASAVVPMTIMSMFGNGSRTLTVTCEARYDIADTDIVFVLDTTGSMACKPERGETDCGNYTNGRSYTYTRPASPGAVPGYAGTTGYAVSEETAGGANVSRIQAVRTAVVNFFNTVEANVDTATHVRYGFVTYSSMVNAGKAIMDVSPSYMIGGSGSANWTYQSRSLIGDYAVSVGGWTDISRTRSECDALTSTRSLPSGRYDGNNRATITDYRWNNAVNPSRCQQRVTNVGPQWRYQPVSYDVSGYVSGASVTDPSQVDGAMTRWWGCIEERATTAGASSFDTNSLPPDLDPSLIPYNADTRWRPYWPDVEYDRPDPAVYSVTNGDSDGTPNYVNPNRMTLGKNSCAKPIQRLKVMTASDVSAYVNAGDFKPLGGTYHDVGMIWGVRLLSPSGIFGGDTGAWPGRPAPTRVIVFLTDGEMSPSVDAYGFYGVEQMDKRVTGGDLANRETYHNARFLAECTKAKSLGMQVWTIAIAPAANDQLTSCASSSSQALFTTSGTELNSQFQRIAQQVALLRVSK
ncbi:pilus assembly protein [Sphingomonas ginsenosidivorax]|uniref:Pilus assembly protein n=1 Tax=Sphingomonas ginsenosidivorax TaxID=862135 RepID=A0A5C6UF85_9SPHN|nr:pilus assembly protein [Sphingomonas ginsenosidivorax]